MATPSLGSTPGSPEWWMTRLVYRLMDRQTRYDVLEAYVEGNHPLPDGDEKYFKALRTMQAKARTNYMGMITTAPVERMKLKDFLVNGEANEVLNNWWYESNGDFQAPIVHLTSAALGNNFVKVSPGTPGPFSNGMPKFQAKDPRTTITEEDPADPMVTLAALEMWQSDHDRVFRAVLYLPDFTYFFEGPGQTEVGMLDRPGLTERLLTFGAGGFNLVHTEATAFGVVPLVRFDWIPSYKGMSRSEAEDVIDIQNRINSTILDRMVISRSQAYKQRYATGIKMPKTPPGGHAKPPFDPGSDILWVSDNPDAKFGEFNEADIRQVLEAIRDDVADMAAITKTPAHYLMGKMANVSGSTLDQAEAGMISKTKQRMTAMGTAWTKVSRLALLFMGESELAKARIEPCWYDPAYHSQAESADALLKHVQAGVPLSVAAQRFGDYTTIELEQIAAYDEEQKALAAEQAAAELAAKSAPTNSGSTTNEE